MHCSCETVLSHCSSYKGCAKLLENLKIRAKLTKITFGWVLLYFEWFPVDSEIRLTFVLQMRLKDLLPIRGLPQEYVLQTVFVGCIIVNYKLVEPTFFADFELIGHLIAGVLAIFSATRHDYYCDDLRVRREIVLVTVVSVLGCRLLCVDVR